MMKQETTVSEVRRERVDTWWPQQRTYIRFKIQEPYFTHANAGCAVKLPKKLQSFQDSVQ